MTLVVSYVGIPYLPYVKQKEERKKKEDSNLEHWCKWMQGYNKQ
jgi:hypothetical protein